MSYKNISYSDKYCDDKYEYRHVVLPREIAKLVPKSHLMSEEEWRGIGVQQSKGWVHYMFHQPEPHILLFRRPLNFEQNLNNNQKSEGGTKMMV
ncbi:cyclin-dependent kinases regulatory subunit 2-like [Neocloeon triangulifer]|uniref:cyclin-dependent kinases regulatory subunit 2-like n=1 Tax=Neocloeon triangulifer TaxID=2078957 RepID=UPI00286F0E05|nr:cyclin-dependent kinases regulatory subunit 2-like [Neocloeon triangulifer]